MRSTQSWRMSPVLGGAVGLQRGLGRSRASHRCHRRRRCRQNPARHCFRRYLWCRWCRRYPPRDPRGPVPPRRCRDPGARCRPPVPRPPRCRRLAAPPVPTLAPLPPVAAPPLPGAGPAGSRPSGAPPPGGASSAGTSSGPPGRAATPNRRGEARPADQLCRSPSPLSCRSSASRLTNRSSPATKG